MKPILFVDGYNVIGAWARADREGWTLDECRDRLMHLLEDYAGYTGQEVVLVFDGHHSERPVSTVDEKAALTLVYTRHGQTADQYIERSCAQLPVYREARVATSDHLEQTIILGRGATRVSSAELLRDLESTRREGRDRHQPTGHAALGSFAAALSPEQREALEAIRRRK